MAAVHGHLFCGKVAVDNSSYWGSYRFTYRICYAVNEFHDISHGVSSCKTTGKEHS